MTPDDDPRLDALRARLLDVGDEPDVAPAVMARLASEGRAPILAARRGRRVIPLVAAAVAGIVIGATVASGGLPWHRPSPVSAGVTERVLSAQTRVDSLSADVSVVEHGWQRAVPVRTYTGTLRYRAPETVALRLTDHTRYPSSAWPRNTVAFVVDGAHAWDSGPVPCPPGAEPGCAPAEPRVRATEGREPFAADLPAPLDLVVPVRSFAVTGSAPALADRHVDGRAAMGVRTTAAQVEPLLSGLRRAGNWRDLYPSDRVDLWLDKASLVPLLVEVYAAGGADHRAWAAGRGYVDRPGDLLLSIELHDVVVNGAVPQSAFPPAPSGTTVVDGGFADVQLYGLHPPASLPGMHPYRAGHTTTGPPVTVLTFTNRAAWVKVRATTGWTGSRLFGHDDGSIVRRTTLPGVGVVYVAEGGQRILIHGADRDVEVTGSIPAAQLLRFAGAQSVGGVDVPADWAEAATSNLAAARGALPHLLVPSSTAGFTAPGVRVDGGIVTLSYTGAGARAFELVQSAGSDLTPPLSADVRGIEVRGLTGRFSPAAGTLEWVEAGHVVEVRSQSLGIGELLSIAAGLRAAP